MIRLWLPAAVLLAAILGTQLIAALIVGFGFLVPALPWAYIGFVWVYALIWVFINDWIKVKTYEHLELSGRRHIGFLRSLQEPLPSHARRV